jgi:glycosyltransferase involved in cell wall biosynthesis
MRLAVLTNAPAHYRVPIFARLAREAGVEARVFFDGSRGLPDASLGFDHEFVAGLTVHRRNYQDRGREAERWPVRIGLRTLPRLAAFRPDVIVSGEFGWRTLQAAAFAAAAGIPLLVWWEGTPFTEQHAGRARTALRRRLAARAAALLAFGSGSHDYLRRVAPDHAAIHRVPQAADNERIAREADRWRGEREAVRAELGARGTVLACVSRLVPPKGIRELLAAARRLRARAGGGAFTLLLAGDGPLRGEAERTSAELGGDLRVLGAVAQTALPRVLAAADLLVFPTLHDCWGMVVNEALAAGIPVIGSRYAGACDELLTREGVGCRFDPTDPASFDAALGDAVLLGRYRGAAAADVRRAVAGHTFDAAARAILTAARGALGGFRLAIPA